VKKVSRVLFLFEKQFSRLFMLIHFSVFMFFFALLLILLPAPPWLEWAPECDCWTCGWAKEPMSDEEIIEVGAAMLVAGLIAQAGTRPPPNLIHPGAGDSSQFPHWLNAVY
jgi:hypothetical protein